MSNETLCILILIFFCITILCYLLYRIKKDGLRKTVVALIVFAEDTYKNNETKFNVVVDSARQIIPMPFRLLFTTDNMAKFVQTVFDETKKALDYTKKS